MIHDDETNIIDARAEPLPYLKICVLFVADCLQSVPFLLYRLVEPKSLIACYISETSTVHVSPRYSNLAFIKSLILQCGQKISNLSSVKYYATLDH